MKEYTVELAVRSSDRLIFRERKISVPRNYEIEDIKREIYEGIDVSIRYLVKIIGIYPTHEAA